MKIKVAMRQSTMWSWQARMHRKGNHRRKEKMAIFFLGDIGNTYFTPSFRGEALSDLMANEGYVYG